jgi:hypothetical protein
MRCRWDLRLSSAQPTGCSPPSSGTPCRSAAPARARPSLGFVGSWRTAGKLLAPANGFLRFRWSIDLTRGIHRKEPGSFRATSPPVTRARARVTGGEGTSSASMWTGTRVPRNTGFPPMTLPFNRSLVGARVERISSARAPEMCPFSKTIRENQTARETFQGFASPTGQRPGAQVPVPPPRSALTSDGAAARGRCLFAHRGKPGWHSGAVFEAPVLVAGFESHARAAKHRIPAHDLAIQPILGRRSGQAD